MSSRWLRAQEPLTLTTAMVVAAVAQLLPLAALGLGLEITSSAGEASRLLSSGALWSLLLATVARSCLIMLLAVALGLPLGFLLGRTNVGARRLAFELHAFPLFLPPFLLALGWFQVFGHEGYLGTEATSALLFGEAGVAVVLTLALAPVVHWRAAGRSRGRADLCVLRGGCGCVRCRVPEASREDRVATPSPRHRIGVAAGAGLLPA